MRLVPLYPFTLSSILLEGLGKSNVGNIFRLISLFLCKKAILTYLSNHLSEVLFMRGHNVLVYINKTLTLLHSERPKLYTILVLLSGVQ